VEDKLLIHGSQASCMLRTLSAGIEVCVTVTLLDGSGFGAISFSSFNELSIGSYLWPGDAG
jgi:hypothetical protein